MDISKCFIESLGVRDNESRLYSFLFKSNVIFSLQQVLITYLCLISHDKTFVDLFFNRPRYDTGKILNRQTNLLLRSRYNIKKRNRSSEPGLSCSKITMSLVKVSLKL